MTYTLIRSPDNSIYSGAVIRDADGASIPADPRNADWQKYQTWLAAANTPTTPPPLTPPPVVYQFLDFMALFTSAEQTAIFASSDTQTKMFITMAAAAGGLQLSNPAVVAGVTYLSQPPTATPPGPGLITAARATAILAGEAPPSS